jgi:SAM-dependent methyltransferase
MTPPFRVTLEVAAGYKAVVGTKADRTLLLGVTRELAEVASDLVAVDRSAARVANVWPGDTDRRRAIVGDWFNLAFRDRCFGAAFGDGGLNILEFPGSQARIFEQLSRVLKPEAIVAMRVFSRPERCETLASVRDEALASRIGNFQAFKLRLAMAIVAAGSSPNIRVRLIRDIFDREFPDRNLLSSATGWSVDDIDTIDLYENSSDVYCFPTEQQFASAIPPRFGGVRFLPVGTYELAERCPLLTMEVRP